MHRKKSGPDRGLWSWLVKHQGWLEQNALAHLQHAVDDAGHSLPTSWVLNDPDLEALRCDGKNRREKDGEKEREEWKTIAARLEAAISEQPSASREHRPLVLLGVLGQLRIPERPWPRSRWRRVGCWLALPAVVVLLRVVIGDFVPPITDTHSLWIGVAIAPLVFCVVRAARTGWRTRRPKRLDEELDCLLSTKGKRGGNGP
jgi:hypothetical protein